jgi:hypothetical protein
MAGTGVRAVTTLFTPAHRGGEGLAACRGVEEMVRYALESGYRLDAAAIDVGGADPGVHRAAPGGSARRGRRLG